jgi:hypothetical protein
MLWPSLLINLICVDGFIIGNIKLTRWRLPEFVIRGGYTNINSVFYHEPFCLQVEHTTQAVEKAAEDKVLC